MRPFSLRDDCMDAGGRAMHGAIAEKDRMRGYVEIVIYFTPSPQPSPEGRGGQEMAVICFSLWALESCEQLFL